MPAPAPSRFADTLRGISSEQTVLIAGPTASGKSALALEIAAQQGGVIVNADASQVYDCWRVLTARPSVAEEAQARHALYGHVGARAPYSTGHWLRETTELLRGEARLIIVGGTGLYFSALTRGLAHIPEVPRDVRATADTMTIEALLDGVDSATRALIDPFNRARVQRAWEVWTTTGRGLSDWQKETADPVLDPKDSFPIVFDVDKDWLNARIEKRFDQMLAQGVLDEVRAVEPEFDPSLPAHRAIGAPELVAHLRGEIPLDGAREAIIIATRQFAKRQRTWLRSKMADWHPVHPG